MIDHGPQSEFDKYAGDYDQLLKDPVRDRFAGDSRFFHERKWIMLRDFFARRNLATASMDWLDVGCGRGELLALGAPSFRSALGCDPSPEMRRLSKIPTVDQPEPTALPFPDGRFDFVTAVCVYHHVPPPDRDRLTADIARVLRPGGVAAVVEHNPFNPATQLIVRRTPVDADAILLRLKETQSLLRRARLEILERQYFLYLPAAVFRFAGALETFGRAVPLGGQYVVLAWKP